MRPLFLSLLLACSSITFAQQLPLAKKITSPEILGEQASTLAKVLLTTYTNTDQTAYLDNRFRIALVAGQYKECLNTIDSFQVFMGLATNPELAAMGIQFRAYALTRLGENNKTRFQEAYYDTLAAVYDRLPEAAKPIAGEFFTGDTIQILGQLKAFIETIKNKDTLSIEEARVLVRNWNSYSVFRQILAPGRRFLDNEDNKKYVIQDSLLIPGHGSAKLSAVIVRPKDAKGPLPVILMSNIYVGPGDKNKAKEAAAQGYVGIIINTRGKHLSPDDIEPYEHDAEDIYAALDWISKQAWCNGKAGMYGGSYLGFSQWAAVKKVHPILKTIVPQVSVGAGIDFPRFNGVNYGYSLQWIHYVSNNKLTDYAEFSNADRWKEVFNKWYDSGLPFRKLDSIDGRPNALFQRWCDHAEFDAFWQKTIPVDQEFQKINIPILTITGYFDDDQRGAVHYYMQHHKWNPRAEHYLFMGPYDHFGAQGAPTPVVQGYTADSTALISITDLVWAWFDYQLRDGKKPEAIMDKVTYQVMGTNQWKGAKNLGALRNDSLVLYLTHRFREEGFALQKQKPSKPGWLEYEIDLKKRPKFDYTPMIQSKELPPMAGQMLFMSEPLEKDITFNGSMEGMVQLILNKKDADISFNLYELTADSNYIRLSGTYERISYVRNPRKRSLVQPGKPFSVPVYNSTLASKLIHKGSRLILVAGVAMDAGLEINYGSGKPVADESMADAKEPLVIQWSNQSYITLPLKK